jgi:hypothetical protein
VFIRKAIDGTEYHTVHRELYGAEFEGRFPTHPAETVRIPVRDNREVVIRKYRDADAQEPGRVVIEKRYSSAREEIDDRCKALMQTGMTRDEAQRRVATEDSGLWARYRHEQAFPGCGPTNGPPADVTPPITKADVLQMAKARVATSADLDRLGALAELVRERDGQREFLETYRDYLLTQGREERDNAHLAKSQAATAHTWSVYDRMHHQRVRTRLFTVCNYYCKTW